MCKTMVRVLEEFEMMTIILDRIDRVQSGPRFVRKLIELLSLSKCNTRILLIADPASGTDWDLDLSDDVGWKGMYLQIRNWDQEEIVPPRRPNYQ